MFKWQQTKTLREGFYLVILFSLLICTVHILCLNPFCPPFSQPFISTFPPTNTPPPPPPPPPALLLVSAYNMSSTNTELLTSQKSQEIEPAEGSFNWGKKLMTFILHTLIT